MYRRFNIERMAGGLGSATSEAKPESPVFMLGLGWFLGMLSFWGLMAWVDHAMKKERAGR